MMMMMNLPILSLLVGVRDTNNVRHAKIINVCSMASNKMVRMMYARR